MLLEAKGKSQLNICNSSVFVVVVVAVTSSNNETSTNLANLWSPNNDSGRKIIQFTDRMAAAASAAAELSFNSNANSRKGFQLIIQKSFQFMSSCEQLKSIRFKLFPFLSL